MVTTRHPLRTRRVQRLATLAAALCLFTLPAVRAAHAAAATLEATVEPSIADEGDPVRLTLRFRGDAPAARPDLSPLEHDFEVLGSQQSQRVSIVNGDVDETRELQILLSPKRSGELEIPALRAGGLESEPLHLTVRDGGGAQAGGSAAAPHASSGAAAPSAAGADVAARVARNGQMPALFVDASVDRTSPFVQGEVRYTVRVYDGVGIREGALTEPAANGVRIEPRGDTRTFEDVVGGRRYVVHEREYAAFPQASGEVVIPPVILQARVPEEPGQARRSQFDDMFDGDDVFAEMFAQMRRSGFAGAVLDRMMDPGHEVRVRSNPVALTVQGRPTDAVQGWFLPATSVTLAQSWSPAHPAFRVGETVKRTLTLRAAGASASQLPEIAPGDAGGVKQYPARPEAHAVPGGAELVQSFDVLPTAAGTVTLPRIEVAWWDTASNTQQTAVLPEETIEILPAAGAEPQQAANAPSTAAQASAASPVTSGSTSSANAAPQSAPKSGAAAPAPSVAAASGATNDVRALLSAHPAASAASAAALLAFLGTAGWLALRRRGGAASARPASAAGSVSEATASRVPARALADAVHQACAANDARAARDALVAWGRGTWRDVPPANAATVARRTGDDTFVRAVKSLDDSLYAPQAAPFDGAALRRAFDAARRAGSRGDAATSDVLPALYPESRLA